MEAGSPRPTPYLLTDREAALFLRAAGTLESPSPWAWQSRAFFMLMACCGLRTREVRRLAVGHVDHKARSIDVVDSKAGRSRRLPVGDEVAAELLECDQRSRERFGDDRPAFFVTSTGNPVSPGMPGVVFRRVWTRAGLEWPQAGKRPRPYDFRHRFAFANIERVFCQVGVGRFGVSFSPCERRVSGRFGVGRSCWLLVIALVIA